MSCIASSRNGGRKCGRNEESFAENAVFKSLLKEWVGLCRLDEKSSGF